MLAIHDLFWKDIHQRTSCERVLSAVNSTGQKLQFANRAVAPWHLFTVVKTAGPYDVRVDIWPHKERWCVEGSKSQVGARKLRRTILKLRTTDTSLIDDDDVV